MQERHKLLSWAEVRPVANAGMEITMKPSTFEEAMERLDAITVRMEQENLPLDEMMALYKEGLELQKYCVKVLDTTEKEIMILQQDEGEGRGE